jgi:hypothetical protein
LLQLASEVGLKMDPTLQIIMEQLKELKNGKKSYKDIEVA